MGPFRLKHPLAALARAPSCLGGHCPPEVRSGTSNFRHCPSDVKQPALSVRGQVWRQQLSALSVRGQAAWKPKQMFGLPHAFSLCLCIKTHEKPKHGFDRHVLEPLDGLRHHPPINDWQIEANMINLYMSHKTLDTIYLKMVASSL